MHRQRGLFTATLVLLIVVALILGYVAYQYSQAVGREYDCVDFATQEEAQKFFGENPNDIYGLDWNRNGVACEDLPHMTNYPISL